MNNCHYNFYHSVLYRSDDALKVILICVMLAKLWSVDRFTWTCALCLTFFPPRVNERPERTQTVELVSCTASSSDVAAWRSCHFIRLTVANSSLMVHWLNNNNRLVILKLKMVCPHLCFSHQVRNGLTSSERSWRRSRGRNLSRKQPTRNFSPLSANRATIRVKRRAVMRTKKRSCSKKVVCSLFLHQGQHR